MSKQGIAARVSARPVDGSAAPVVLPHAYALVQDAAGGWHALHLEGVTAQKVTRLEPNERAEPGMFAASRVTLAIERRYRLDLQAGSRRARDARLAAQEGGKP